MRLSTAFAVLLAAAIATMPAHANMVSSAVAVLGAAFSKLIKTQALIKSVEKRNDDFLSPALTEISSELHQGLDSNIFKIGNGIHNTLVDVNLKIGQIAGNATSIISQIESVANTVSLLNFSNARLDYNVKKNRIKKLCDDTLATTTIVLGLIDETKEMLGKGVTGPLKMLQLTVRMTSDDRIIRENANIKLQQGVIDHPPKWLIFFTDHEAVETAQYLKRQGLTAIARIQNLVEKILGHTKWLEEVCHTIREELDKERTTISEIEGKISSASGSVNMISDGFDSLFGDSQNMSEDYLREGSQALVQVMISLRNEVRAITRGRVTRAAGSHYPTYQIASEDNSPAVFQHPVRSSWLDKTPDNGCFYIYNNRTTGCVSVITFENMKMQYNLLSNKFSEFDTLYRSYEKGLGKLATQVLNLSKSTTNEFEGIKFVSELETNKVLWSDDIKKIRDFAASLSSYAESTFSDEKAQLKIMRSNDNKLNEDIMRYVDDNKKKAMDIFMKNFNDILVINNQVADILNRLSVKVTNANSGPDRDGGYQQQHRPAASQPTAANKYQYTSYY